MGELVLSDRHPHALDDDDVRALQNWIREQAQVHVLRMLLGHLLEGGSTLDPAERGHHRQQEVELCDLRHLGLLIDDAPRRIDADSQQVRGQIEHLVLDLVPVGLGREGVVIRDEVEALVLALEVDPVLGRAEVIAEVEPSRGPDAAQDSYPLRHRFPSVVDDRRNTI